MDYYNEAHNLSIFLLFLTSIHNIRLDFLLILLCHLKYQYYLNLENILNLKYLLNLIASNCKILQLEQTTEGAACTVLTSKDYINNDAIGD